MVDGQRPAKNGAQLALDDANAKYPTLNGKPAFYKLASADDQSDPRTAVSSCPVPIST